MFCESYGGEYVVLSSLGGSEKISLDKPGEESIIKSDLWHSKIGEKGIREERETQ